MNTQLPGFVIAGLYKDSLVLLDEHANESNEPETPMPPALPYLGNNLQHISIFLKNTGHIFTDDESLQLITNLLAALNYNLADVAIINWHRTPVLYDELSRQLHPRICLLFGVNAQLIRLPFIIPNYQQQQYEGCTILQACDIQDMKGEGEKAKAEKRKLWNCLKIIFNL